MSNEKLRRGYLTSALLSVGVIRVLVEVLSCVHSIIEQKLLPETAAVFTNRYPVTDSQVIKLFGLSANREVDLRKPRDSDTSPIRKNLGL